MNLKKLLNLKKESIEEPLFPISFRDYLDTLKPKTPEEEFAIRVLKSLCTKPTDYGHTNKTVFGIYCYDCTDQDWYTIYFSEMLKPFKPIWNNCNDRDMLRKLGIVFLRRKVDAIGYNLRGILVSKKWIDLLDGKMSYHGPKRDCKILDDWIETMGYFERRMRARFLNNYFIMTSSDENVCTSNFPNRELISDFALI